MWKRAIFFSFFRKISEHFVICIIRFKFQLKLSKLDCREVLSFPGFDVVAAAAAAAAAV